MRFPRSGPGCPGPLSETLVELTGIEPVTS